MASGIYQIVHIATGRRYVGQAANITKRWAAHRLRLKAANHHAPHLQAAWTKYGPDAFFFAIVEECIIEHLDRVEQHYLDEWRPEFNTAKFARTRRGVPHSEEAKAKLSASLKGRKRTPEECAAIAAAVTGLRHSDEAKAKMRAAKIGRKHSDQSRQNMAEAQRKRERQPGEYDSRRGVKRDPDVIARSASTRTGVKRTPEQIERMKRAAAAMSPEKREIIAQARREAIASRTL